MYIIIFILKYFFSRVDSMLETELATLVCYDPTGRNDLPPCYKWEIEV